MNQQVAIDIVLNYTTLVIMCHGTSSISCSRVDTGLLIKGNKTAGHKAEKPSGWTTSATAHNIATVPHNKQN